MKYRNFKIKTEKQGTKYVSTGNRDGNTFIDRDAIIAKSQKKIKNQIDNFLDDKEDGS